MKRTRLRKLSKKREADYRAYLKERDAMLSQPFIACEFPDCWAKPTEIHHMKGRTGLLLRDQKYWMFVCRIHHRWIHDNMKEARKKGLVLWK